MITDSIDSIALQTLRNAEYLQFLKQILAIVNANDPKALSIKPQYNKLQLAYGVVDGLFANDQSNPLTQALVDLDIRRDNAITGISTLLNAFSYHFDALIASQAQTLTNHLANYGTGIARETALAETAIIANIVADWNTSPEMVSAIKALNLKAWAAELETANTAFDTQYLARNQTMGAASPDTMKQKRQEATNSYYELRNKLNGYFIVNDGAEPFTKTTNELNALIGQYNVLITGRKSGTPTANATGGEIPPMVA